MQRLGKAINLSVERFVTVGETIAETERKDMLEACRETRLELRMYKYIKVLRGQMVQ